MTPHKSEDSVFIHNLFEFLGETEGQDLDDIKNELREEGIDVDAFVTKVKGVITQKSKELEAKDTVYCWPCDYMTTGVSHGCLLCHKITQEGPIRSATRRLDECLRDYRVSMSGKKG
jgi:hypothetical protein